MEVPCGKPSARERILATAAELFYRKGVRNVGVDEIVARSGVAKMTLYCHFKSKDLLIGEFLRERDARWRAWFEETAAERAASPRERLLLLFDLLEEWVQAPDFRGCAFINATIELADPEHPGHAAALEHKRYLRDFLEGAAHDAGAPRSACLAHQLFLLAEGATVAALMGCGAEAARQARAAAEVLLGAATA